MTKPLIIVGAGGHGRVVLDMARAAGILVAGFLDSTQPAGELVHAVPILGNNTMLDDGAFLSAYRFIVAIGHQAVRANLSKAILANGGELASIIHPSCIVSPMAVIGAGTVLIAGAIVNSDAQIGDYCIINTAATIDHDVMLENGVQICPGVNIAGRAYCGENAFIGTGAVLIPDVRVGANAVIGAGAVVIRNIPAEAKAVGNPARILS